MEELPYGTGSLYVTDPDKKHLLKKETRSLNSTERAEAVAVQYLLLGGHSRFTGLPRSKKPLRVFSSIHAGPGQIVFGYSEKQRADLTLAFKRGDENSRQVELHYFNYHGYHWHYDGHMEQCPSTTDRYTDMFVNKETKLMDSFRRAHAVAMSQVFPENVTYHYHVIYECELVHGIPIPSLLHPESGKTYYSAQELLTEEMRDSFYLPPPNKLYFDKETLTSEIAAGRIDGFVTLRGGREGREEPVASKNFGFCVQNYAPAPHELSEHTKAQIAEYYSLEKEAVDNYLLKQSARTLNSTTFHSEETVSTNYLRWLMQERDFKDFEITHFLWYKFGHQSRRFIEPLLQLRHEMKKQGNLPAAEVLKLILNGAYG